MFHPPDRVKPLGAKVLQYLAVFVVNKSGPIALFEKHDVAVMFKEAMTDGQCTIRPYAFTPESTV